MKYFKSKETKKFLGFFMALAMIVSMMPGVANAKKVDLTKISEGKVTETVSGVAVTIDTTNVSGAAVSNSMEVDVDVDVVTASAVAATTASITVTLNKGYVITGSSLKINDEVVIFKEGKGTYTYPSEITDKVKFVFVGKVVKEDTTIPGSMSGSTGSTSSAAPSATPSASATPSVAPSASAAPTASVAPSASASAAPTKAPTESVAPTKAPAKTVKVGTKKTVNGAKYKVTKGNKVTYTAPAKKTAKVTIPATVKINGVTCKVTTIGKGAFKGNTKIKTVSLGKNITKIEANAFKGCKNLKTITIKSTSLTKKNVAKTAFKGINKKATFKVPAKKVKAYKTVVKYAGAPKTVKVKK